MVLTLGFTAARDSFCSFARSHREQADKSESGFDPKPFEQGLSNDLTTIRLSYPLAKSWQVLFSFYDRSYWGLELMTLKVPSAIK